MVKSKVINNSESGNHSRRREMRNNQKSRNSSSKRAPNETESLERADAAEERKEITPEGLRQ